MKKHFLSLFLCLVLFTLLLPASAFAESGAVTLTPRQDSAGVTVTLPQGVDSGVTSLRLSFQVQLTGGDSEKTSAQFSFDGALPGSVREYRYDARTGRLNLYVAGRDKLFTDNTVRLGSLVLTSSDAAGATASVSVVENSLELANAAHGAEKPGVDVQTVELAVGSTQQPETPEEGSSSSSSAASSSSASSAPAASQPAGNAPTGGTTQTSSSSKTSGGKQNAQSDSDSVSVSPDSSVSQGSESTSVSASSSAASSSSSALESEAQPSSSGSVLMYVIIGVLFVAVLIAAFVVFKRRK